MEYGRRSCHRLGPSRIKHRLGPYMDGNGRMGRFLMNLMLAAGGYPWTVISVGDRKIYMEALEKGSVDEEIVSFIDFIASLVKKGLAGEPLPALPRSSS